MPSATFRSSAFAFLSESSSNLLSHPSSFSIRFFPQPAPTLSCLLCFYTRCLLFRVDFSFWPFVTADGICLWLILLQLKTLGLKWPLNGQPQTSSSLPFRMFLFSCRMDLLQESLYRVKCRAKKSAHIVPWLETWLIHVGEFRGRDVEHTIELTAHDWKQKLISGLMLKVPFNPGQIPFLSKFTIQMKLFR